MVLQGRLKHSEYTRDVMLYCTRLYVASLLKPNVRCKTCIQEVYGISDIFLLITPYE